MWWSSILAVCFSWLVFSTVNFDRISAIRVYDEKRITELREEVLSVFYHGYNNYIEHAYPYDELRPLSCDGVDTWGSYSLTLIDTLDTLAVVGNYSEFRRVAQLILENAHFDMNINVSVFETNIRILGGLLSAHLLSQKAGMEIEPGWPCQGPLLRLAETVARKLLPAFDTPTGMPFGTVNLRYGVPPHETPVTCTAGVGTFVVEFGALSRLTGDPIYEKVALRAIHSLFEKRSPLDLVGNHIDTKTGKWTAIDAGIGAGVDSFFEYLVKGSILFQTPELMHMFQIFHRAIEKHLGKGGWYVWATMGQGHVSATTFQSLETFFPGMLSLVGEFKTGLKAMTNYHRILKQYGGLPELYNILQGKATHQREGYPLRPELIESAMYLYRGTGDPYMLEIGEDILHSIQYNARTECGYATIRDVTTLTLEDRMESFFLAETVKYLYLLFDPNNFIHSEGEDVTVVETPRGKCTVYAGGYIFNTEAHPIDPSALNCCTGVGEDELHKEIEIIDEIRSSQVFSAIKKAKKQARDKSDRKKQKRKKKKNIVADEAALEAAVNNQVEEEDSPAAADSPSVISVSSSDLADSSRRSKFPALKEKYISKTIDIIQQQHIAFAKSDYLNPLLNFKKKDLSSFTPNPFLANNNNNISINWSSSSSSLPFMQTVTSQSDNVVFKLLKKLLDETPDYKEAVRKEFASGGMQKGLQFESSKEDKELERLVQKFETNLKAAEEADSVQRQSLAGIVGNKLQQNNKNAEILTTIQQQTGGKKKGTASIISIKPENRILPKSPQGDETDPDLDLIFGTSPTSRSLSFYFSLKWLPAFPSILLRHLLPSEGFDIQNFYSRINELSSASEGGEGGWWSKKYNISDAWVDNYDVLRCPNLKLADRFMFFRSSVED